jgi:hypothetical protein
MTGAEDLAHSIQKRGYAAAVDAWVVVGGVVRSAVVVDGV